MAAEENTIRYELTVDDVLAFSEYLKKRRDEGQPRTRSWAWIALAILGCLMVFAAAATGGLRSTWRQLPDNPLDWLRVLVVPTVLVIFVLVRVFGRQIDAYLLRRSLRRPENAANMGSRVLSISAAGLTVTTPSVTTTSPWEDVTEVADTSDHVFLYTGSELAHIVPRRAFATSAQFQAFIERVNRYRGNRSHQ